MTTPADTPKAPNTELQRERLRQVQAALNAIPGVHAHDIRSFLDGNLSVNRKGQLKLPVTLPAAEMLQQPNDVAGVLRGEWKMVPLLVFVSDEAA